MQKVIIFTLLISLISLISCQQENAQPAEGGAGDNILSVRSLLDAKCPAEGANIDNSKASHFFFDPMKRQKCTKMTDLVWSKTECGEGGALKYTLCVDEKCEKCVTRDIKSDECISGNVYKCIPKNEISKMVDLNQKTIRLSLHKVEESQEGSTEGGANAQPSEGANAQPTEGGANAQPAEGGANAEGESGATCTDQNLLAWGYFQPDKCETLAGFYFTMKPAEDNKKVALTLYKDKECKKAVNIFGDIKEIPIPTDKCMDAAIVQGQVALQVSVMEGGQQPSAGGEGAQPSGEGNQPQ